MQKLYDLYKIDRDKLLKSKPIEKRLSCNFLKYEFDGEWYYINAHRFLLKQFYDLFKFITEENEPVLIMDPATNLSQCSLIKNEINLGTKILYDNRFSQQFKVDVAFGIMVHEMFHKLITNISLGKILNISSNLYYNNPIVLKEIPIMLKDKLYSSIMNILEDRRIERLGLNKFPGYVFYFDEKRKHAYEIHKEAITRISELNEDQLIINFILYKILLPEIIDDYLIEINNYYLLLLDKPKYGKKKIDKIIKSINDYVDLNETLVFSDEILDLFKASDEIISLLPVAMRNAMKKNNDYVNSNQPLGQDSMDDIDGCHDKSCEKIKIMIGKELQKIQVNQVEQHKPESSVRYESIELNDDDSGIYNNVIIATVDYKIIDEEIMKPAQEHANKIKNNLAYLASRLNIKRNNYELNEGEIDEDELYSIRFSNDIFYTEEDITGFELDLGILIDESGSMCNNDKIKDAKTVALACILSMINFDFINLFVYGHSQLRNMHNAGCVELYEYYNQKRKISNWKNIFAAKAAGGNADGYAIKKFSEIMIKDSKGIKKIMIVISDGLPAATNYGGLSAENHVKSIVDELERKGFEIVQICIDNIQRSKHMFNNFIPFNNDFIKDFNDFLRKKISQISDSF